jgi:lactoylglutathione lyase
LAAGQSFLRCESFVWHTCPMTIEIASIVLYSNKVAELANFYAAVGAALENEQHEDGPVHFAVEIGSAHFAIYQADGDSVTASHREPGEVFVGFYVDSLDAVIGAMAGNGVSPIAPHEQMPWGCRVLFQDPDGRTVEVNDKSHCTAD